MVILHLRAVLEYFILYLEAVEVFRVSTNICNPDVVSRKAANYTFKKFKYNAENGRMSKRHLLSIHHREKMGLIFKFQQRLNISPTTSRPKVAELPDGKSSVGRDATGNYEKKAGEEAAAPAAAAPAQKEEEEEEEEEEEKGKETPHDDDEEKPLVVFKSTKRLKKQPCNTLIISLMRLENLFVFFQIIN